MKVYWNLYPLVDFDFNALLLICYIIDVYGVLKEKTVINGEEYRRLSDSFIGERLEMSSPTIRKTLTLLQNKNLIKIAVTRGNEKGQSRYIQLLVGINENINENISENINENINEKICKKTDKHTKQNNIKRESKNNQFYSESIDIDPIRSNLVF